MLQATLRIECPIGRTHEVLGLLRRLKGPSVFTKGYVASAIFQDAENAQVITYVVRWDTREQLNAHLRCEGFRKLLPYIELSNQPPKFEISQVELIGMLDLLVEILTGGSNDTAGV